MNPARRYAETQITTASREQLLLMLLDGAVRFTTQARELLASGDRSAAPPLLLKGQAIALELVNALDRSLEPSLYQNLSGLYLFVYRRLVAANLEQSAKAAEEALEILGKLRGMWGEAVAKMKAEALPVPAGK